jgi:hypothetical protein
LEKKLLGCDSGGSYKENDQEDDKQAFLSAIWAGRSAHFPRVIGKIQLFHEASWEKRYAL